MSRDEETILKTLAGKVEDASKKENVMEIFDIFSGKKALINAIPYCFTLDCLITRESTTIVNKL